MAQTTVICGASRGIGLEMARQASARGDVVFATARRPSDELDAVSATVLTCDVTDEASLKAAAAAIAGPVDLLVCNAGIFRGRGGMDAEDTGADAWAEVLMTNVAGPFLAVRAFLPKMRQPGDSVAIVSSIMASSGQAPGGAYLYRASKAGATNVARNLASDLQHQGIAVGAYHPGWVRTDMGGTGADIGVEESAAGLLARFEALSMETTGVFEDYRGRAIPF
ncbi:MAG: SDR family oxidoreductase [Pseudomonadota bacterium]